MLFQDGVKATFPFSANDNGISVSLFKSENSQFLAFHMITT